MFYSLARNHGDESPIFMSLVCTPDESWFDSMLEPNAKMFGCSPPTGHQDWKCTACNKVLTADHLYSVKHCRSAQWAHYRIFATQRPSQTRCWESTWARRQRAKRAHRHLASRMLIGDRHLASRMLRQPRVQTRRPCMCPRRRAALGRPLRLRCFHRAILQLRLASPMLLRR